MRVSIITIFPEIFEGFLSSSLVARAVKDGLLGIRISDLRTFTHDRHRSVDDEPYGGGAGMVMMAGPWIEAIDSLAEGQPVHRVLLTPRGERLTDRRIQRLSEVSHLMLLCGRYEGVDERVRSVVDEEISIGDYVLSGGEVPAMVLIEAISRQLPGVVGRPESVENDSFRTGILDFPQYTRPRVVAGMEVPKILMSGNHEAISAWRREQALRATLERRPDLLREADLSEKDREYLHGLGWQKRH